MYEKYLTNLTSIHDESSPKTKNVEELQQLENII